VSGPGVNDADAPADHITPYDRLALDEASLIALLAARTPHEGLIEYFGAELHAELATLARATARKRRAAPRRRVYVLPGIMGSQLGFIRGAARPNDILWLDPIDIAFGRLTALKLDDASKIVALGAMSYSYLKITLSLRKAGFDAVLLDYDWRRDIATLGKFLAQRIAEDGRDGIALIGHSMGGLVARAALMHPAGKQVSQLIMLGTPNAGSLAAVQALRGTYSVVRKIAMLDLRHDAEYLARNVFASFPGLHELLPANKSVSDLDLFDPGAWPASGPGPEAVLLRSAAGLEQRMAPADGRFTMVVGCNRTTATGVALRDGDFEYEYSLQGDGTVPIELARLAGARHSYVECGHSDMPLSHRVIAGTVDLLNTGATQRFAAAPPVKRGSLTRVRDAELRAQYQGKVDWSHMTPEQRRLFLDTLNEAPRGRAHLRPQRPVSARPLTVRVRVGDVANARAAATAVAVLRGVPANGAAADIDQRLGGVIGDWLQHRVVSGDAGHVTPIPRSLQRKRNPHGAYLLVGLGRFDRLSLDVIEHAAENLARFAQVPRYRSVATVAWGAHSGIAPADSFAAQLRGFLRARSAGQAGLTRVDLHVLTRAAAKAVHARLGDFVKARPTGVLRLAPLAPSRATAGTRSRRVPGTAHLIVAAESRGNSRRRRTETWRASLLTGGSSAAIFSQSQEFPAAELERLDREFQRESLTTAQVKDLGARLGALTLNPALMRALVATRGQALSVVHDAASSRVPWEALNLRGWFPALEGGLSRRYATADLVPARFDAERRVQRGLGVLLIANPTGDLPGAADERDRIAHLFARSRNVHLTEVVGDAATLARVTAEFESGRYDVIHYAGHASFDAKNPGDGGLALADGELTGAKLSALGRLPPLVVFNACESARLRRGAGRKTATTRRGQSIVKNLSLAETLLRAGLAHYIGTHWPVDDASATAFASVFYAQLLRGSIGSALVKARRAIHARRSPDWADYVHYGDAEFRLKAP